MHEKKERIFFFGKKGIFCRTESIAMTPQITWPYAYRMPTAVACKMANSSSEDETDNFARETHKDTAVSVWACQAGFWKSTGTSCQLRSKNPMRYSMRFAKSALTEVLATQMGVMWRSKKVSSFELY